MTAAMLAKSVSILSMDLITSKRLIQRNIARCFRFMCQKFGFHGSHPYQICQLSEAHRRWRRRSVGGETSQ